MIRLLNCTLLVVVLAGCGHGPADSGARPPGNGGAGPAVGGPSAAKPGPIIQLDQRCIAELVRAYENEAAGDAKFTGRTVQFSRVPGGVEKADGGRYVAWYCQVEGESTRHVLCYFKPDQSAALAAIGGSPLTLRGRVVGRVGVDKRYGNPIPIVTLEDCEVVKP